MNKICTSLEQSKKLMELGIDINTADMDYIPCVNDMSTYSCVINEWNNEHEENWIPAWSLSALLKLLPTLGYRNPVLAKDIFDNNWRCLYHRTAVNRLIDTQDYDEPIDAAFEMVCWLKENGKI